MHSYILSSYSQSKLYQAVLDDVAKSSREIRQLKRRACKNPFAGIQLTRIINDILQMRLNLKDKLEFR